MRAIHNPHDHGYPWLFVHYKQLNTTTFIRALPTSSLYSSKMSALEPCTSSGVESKSFRDCDWTGNHLSQTIIFSLQWLFMVDKEYSQLAFAKTNADAWLLEAPICVPRVPSSRGFQSMPTVEKYSDRRHYGLG